MVKLFDECGGEDHRVACVDWLGGVGWYCFCLIWRISVVLCCVLWNVRIHYGYGDGSLLYGVGKQVNVVPRFCGGV